jgi:hypothetical protein
MQGVIFLMLSKSIATEYAQYISEEISDEVRQDVETSADKDFNEDDLRLAIGRVLCEKLNIII